MQKKIFFLHLSLILLLLSQFLPALAHGNLPLITTEETHIIYMPLIHNSDTFFQVPSIWVHDEEPAPHEVALFKHSFLTEHILAEGELQIFADTRYQVWLDGNWIGRGPARFMQNWREYDVYPIEIGSPGEHTIAVLVQWAPNTRRSESVTPGLQARLLDRSGLQTVTITQTNSNWLGVLSPAWRQDAADIAPYNLIGPSELLDFRLYPEDWLFPGDTDNTWHSVFHKDITSNLSGLLPRKPQVVADMTDENLSYVEITAGSNTVDPLSIHYQPRSIPAPGETPVDYSLLDAGDLHPGFLIGEILPGSAIPYEIPFEASEQTTFTLELVSDSIPDSQLIQIDNSDTTWQYWGEDRPDVIFSQFTLEKGAHKLTFNSIPELGHTFAVSSTNLVFPFFPFEQGLHAGRRLLLAEPVSNSNVADHEIESSTGNIQIQSTPAYLVLDLGRSLQGRLVAEIDAPAGTIIDIGWDERLYNDQRPLPYPGSLYPEWNQVDSWIADGTVRKLTTLDTRTGRYILITIWGEKPVTLRQLKILEERAQVEQIGSFSSSNPELDSIWSIGVESILINLNDAYTDTPWRERGQWWGDAYVEDQALSVSLEDNGLLRRGLILMAQAMQVNKAPGMSPNNGGLHLLDYSMLWVHSLSEYLVRTGDQSLAYELYPSLLSFMDYLESLEAVPTQLIELPKLHWSGTAYIDVRCPNCRYGQSTPINSLYVSTLLHAARIADSQSDTQRALSWRDKAATIRTSINTYLYIPEENRYATTLYEGQLINAGPHAQAWALAYGVPSEEQVPNVVSALLELLSSDPTAPNLDIYGMFWVLKGLGETGYIQEAIDIIESYYGYLLDLGANTWWENFMANSFRYNSFSHGWGVAPTWFLSTYVLGFKQISPNRFELTPAIGYLKSAEGKIPFANSHISIAWRQTTCQGYELEVQADPGINYELNLPITNFTRSIYLEGSLNNKIADFYSAGLSTPTSQIKIPLQGGYYKIIVENSCP